MSFIGKTWPFWGDDEKHWNANVVREREIRIELATGLSALCLKEPDIQMLTVGVLSEGFNWQFGSVFSPHF